MKFLSSRRRAAGAATLALTAALALTACGSGTTKSAGPVAVVSQQAQNSPYQGTVLAKHFDKPDLVLTDTSGQPFDLRKQTAGKTTLLYFGYTSCPDVCPTTMGDIGVALQKLPADQQAEINVVFVSTDPQVDTPKVLRTWLDSFNKNFIGLTGDLTTVKAAAQSLGILVEDPIVNKDGTVTSTHGAQVLAFQPSDDKAHVVYLSDTSTATFEHDLPLFAKGVAA
ncbi:protein SCO1/2 [Kitasatospora sp. GAS204A]|uniref:SCO family protein n=1 Tax=unclassified Kitasatospora TaxID=2633591 RepID=UPI002476AD52|nr:SCO family protein [Kitasatospora sp. GAS204B]MDH6119482.1 protein SCO1/2 [Kitasatospora sp. GAS204B]